MSDTTRPGTLELPCTVCGYAAAEVTAPQLDAVSRYAISKMLRLKGAAVDTEAATFGFTGAQMAAALSVRCIPCVSQGLFPSPSPE